MAWILIRMFYSCRNNFSVKKRSSYLLRELHLVGWTLNLFIASFSDLKKKKIQNLFLSILFKSFFLLHLQISLMRAFPLLFPDRFSPSLSSSPVGCWGWPWVGSVPEVDRVPFGGVILGPCPARASCREELFITPAPSKVLAHGGQYMTRATTMDSWGLEVTNALRPTLPVLLLASGAELPTCFAFPPCKL